MKNNPSCHTHLLLLCTYINICSNNIRFFFFYCTKTSVTSKLIIHFSIYFINKYNNKYWIIHIYKTLLTLPTLKIELKDFIHNNIENISVNIMDLKHNKITLPYCR